MTSLTDIDLREWNTMHRSRPWTIGVLACLLWTASCSDTDRTGAHFCAELAKNLSGLSGPLQTSADSADLSSRYRSLDKMTPLAIQNDWHTITELVRQATKVDPADPLSLQELADSAYRAERPARNVALWVEATCGLPMPDVIGIEGSIPPTTATP